ncbi:MAG: hypothetical protein K0S38_93 [Candidatus Paceibacter sp.]|nr:hypothetical protein [Candidatus Paceibacter sp.]
MPCTEPGAVSHSRTADGDFPVLIPPMDPNRLQLTREVTDEEEVELVRSGV